MRTPCGRCAQVIVEGKETLQIDGEANKKPPTPKHQTKHKTNPKTNTKKHHSGPPTNVGSVSSVLKVRQVRTTSCKMSKGLNFLRRQNASNGTCTDRPIKGGRTPLAGVKSSKPLWMVGTWRSLTACEVPRAKSAVVGRLRSTSHRLQSMASRGKYPLRGTIHTTDCAYEDSGLS